MKRKLRLLKKAFFTATLFILSLNVYAIDYYVTTTGDDGKDGKSLANAFASIQKAHDVANPGDVINVADGIYINDVNITRSGNSNNWITYRSINKHGAKLTNNYGNCFNITNPADIAYIIIDGFDLKATSTYGNGVASDNGAHHITVKNCLVHDCGASGIQLNHGDYILAENNVCYNNSTLFENLSGSGISIYGKKRFPAGPNAEYHVILRGNISYNNVNGPVSPKSDGNGIIIDDLRCIQDFHRTFNIPVDANYIDHPVLVENNLCYGNEGAGIISFLSNNITIRNNTTFNNQVRRTTDTYRGEITASSSANVRFINNIAVANSSARADGGATDWAPFANNTALGAFSATGNEYGINYTYYNNITYDINNITSNSINTGGGISVSVVGVNGNKCAVNPLLINSGRLSNSDFHVQSNSPAIDAGTISFGLPPSDLDGKARIQGTTVDIGCYEFVGTATPVTTTIKVRAQSVGRAGANMRIEIMDSKAVTGGVVTQSKDFTNLSRPYAEYTATFNGVIPADRVRVRFTNDRNFDLRVDYIEITGTKYQSEAASTYSIGNYSQANGCNNSGYLGVDILHCNGYFHYNSPGNGNTKEDQSIGSSSNQILVYPNPSKGKIQLQFQSLKSETASIIITDLSGRVIKEILTKTVIGVNTLSFNLSTHPETYILQLRRSDKVETKKIIIE
jgi:parallel beta-helix repeat protein